MQASKGRGGSGVQEKESKLLFHAHIRMLTIWKPFNSEAKYDLTGQSKKHGWSPKLSLRLSNMNFNNAYRIYLALMEEHNPGRKVLSISERIKEAAHSLLQEGPEMRKQVPEHASPVKDLRNVHDSECGRKERKNTKGAVSAERSPPIMQVLDSTKQSKLKGQQKHNPWRQHQSMSCAPLTGRCCWGKLPGIAASIAAGWKTAWRRVTTRYCKECTVSLGKYVFLCSTKFKGDNFSCHVKYHSNKHKNEMNENQ